MARPLPLMDYNALVGDQISQQQVPLMSNGMPTAMPQSNMPARPIPTYAELCQQIAMYEQANGPMTGARLQEAEYTMQRLGYPSVSKCNGNQSPFQNETIQYALLFLLLYVVIKKL